MTITKVKHARALTGGGAGALDSFPVATLNLGTYLYRAMVLSGGKFYYYEYDPAGTAAEDSPRIIRPDDYATAGNWVLGSSPYGDLQVVPEIVAGLPLEGEITGGDASNYGNTVTYFPVSCLDQVAWSTKLFTTVNKTVVIPTVVGMIYHIFIVKLVADGSCEFRAYSTEAAVATDSQVSAYRYLDFWRTDAIGVVVDGVQIAGTHWNMRASKAAINAASQPPAGCSTAVSLSAVLPSNYRVKEVLIGAVGTADGKVCIGWDGVYTHDYIVTSATYNTESDIFAWGARQAGWMPITSSNIYWGDGTDATANLACLLLHAVKLRR